MRLRQLAVVCLLVGFGTATLAVPGVAIHETGDETANLEEPEEFDEQFGVQVSSFVQASAADTRESVDRSLWEISINRSIDPATAIENRTANIGERLEQLETQVSELEQQRENLSTAAYTARASGLRAQIANVHSHIEEVNQTAVQRGVNPGMLEELREKATHMTGPEISDLAQNITDAPGGPPGAAEPSADTEPANNPKTDSEDNRGTELADNHTAKLADNRGAGPKERNTKSAVMSDTRNTSLSEQPETRPSRTEKSNIATEKEDRAGEKKEAHPSPKRHEIDSSASNQQRNDSSGDQQSQNTPSEQQPDNAISEQNSRNSSDRQQSDDPPDMQNSGNTANSQQSDDTPEEQQSDNAASAQPTDRARIEITER
jgi:hypothetical protein